METEAERQGEFKGVLRAVGFEVTAIVDEILQAGLQIDAEMWCDVVLCSETT